MVPVFFVRESVSSERHLLDPVVVAHASAHIDDGGEKDSQDERPAPA